MVSSNENEKNSRQQGRQLIAVASLLAALFAPLAHADWDDAGSMEKKTSKPHCTNADLKGAYGFTANGFTVMGSPLPAALQGAFASGGTSNFDGRGNFTLTATSSFNGVIQGPATIKGTYSVNNDCTYTSQAENGATFRSVIVSDGQELLILQTTPGVIITGIAERQAPSRHQPLDVIGNDRTASCTNEAVEGAYGFLAEGRAGPPTIPASVAGPLAGVGTVDFNRRGTFKLVAQRSLNGVLDPQPLPLQGTYSVNSDCTFQMMFDVGFTFNAAIVDGGKEILFVETDPGTSILVKAKRI